MRTKLNILGNGACAQIYAYAEEHDDPWLVRTKEIRAIRIWHNDTFASLQIEFKPPRNYDNDSVVTFKSKVPFNQFCERFANSEYNQASNYRYFSHNCANAANYALKTAAIDLPINWIKLTSILPSPTWRVPTTILTPIDLFHIGKNFKIRNLQITTLPLSHIHFKMELASSKLLFWAKSAKNDHQKHCVDNIVSSMAQLRHTRPHHTETYLEALIKTSDRLMHNNTRQENKEYKHLIQFFKERISPKTDQEEDKFLNRVALCFLLILIAAVMDYQVGDIKFTLAAISLSILACGQIISSEDTEEDESYKVVDTPLSVAMSELVAELK